MLSYVHLNMPQAVHMSETDSVYLWYISVFGSYNASSTLQAKVILGVKLRVHVSSAVLSEHAVQSGHQ